MVNINQNEAFPVDFLPIVYQRLVPHPVTKMFFEPKTYFLANLGTSPGDYRDFDTHVLDQTLLMVIQTLNIF